MTSGALIIPVKSVNPRKRPIRARTKPAHVPMNTDANAVASAMRSDSQNDVISSPSCASAAYQRVEKRVQTVTSWDSLNE